ncbi:ABC transporter permease subunit [Geodermatophilus sp. DSM 44513]|uniref:branched-chain amino acid ABC transporter ATP-binding protein/permease n=1 Tax=Geodermatophilus sp. DSM 44513 TaxID=1528104 RepID=UPI001274B292|nr:branched-chain amino acid ABC transporter ATP-binding protein/permease [Geodermatophilus sp. DSM 44513]WNV75080.1 branched-chain amino acid ABC transporter ATP-binding protein/permease [Geodermatophilus sp. DSM 44513]
MSYAADIGISVLIYVMLGVSLNLLVGYTGRISMAHAILFGIGGFTAARLTLPPADPTASSGFAAVVSGAGWSWLPALAAATVVAFLGALLISLPAVRLVRGEYLILLTLAFQLVANQLMGVLDWVTGGPYGLSGIPPIELFGISFLTPQRMFWLMLLATVIVVAICWRLGESPFGRLLKGIREYDSAVSSVGKNPVVPELLAFGISAALAGAVGALAAFYYGSVVPGNYTLDLSILIISVVVLGGAGNITGTVVAAVVLGLLTPALREFIGDEAIPWQAVIYGVALILMMRLRPEGLLPEGAGVSRLFRRQRRSPIVHRTPEEALERLAQVGEDPPERSDAIVEVVDLRKSFGGLTAVNGASFALPAGQVTALIGPNGAGKTTIFNMITGTIPIDSGRVFLRGEDVTGNPAHGLVRKGLARSFQDVRLPQRLTALQNVAMAVPGQLGEHVAQLALRPRAVRRREAQTREKALDCLALLGIAEKAEVLAGDLSYGDQKLVAIARLLATDCNVLLLDEPTSGVDPASVDRVVEGIGRLRDLGHTVCLVEHSVHFVQRLADRAVFLDQGAVVAEGSVAELMQRRELADLYFGT